MEGRRERGLEGRNGGRRGEGTAMVMLSENCLECSCHPCKETKWQIIREMSSRFQTEQGTEV